ncbi:orotate phosphoribosyltransferase [Patulibacter sp. NPDC049589]|uniref:orotate phosphoribosyltransferase n=1 Tax=Patulibacter sp. NPDC049589 TaxID=3154731 RepID=UPI003420C16D
MSGIDGSLARRVFECAHLTGEFRLRSGALSTVYFDKYRFEADPQLLRDLAERLAILVPDGADALAGLELGGVPLATVTSQITGLPTLFVRKEPKTYGTCNLAEGGDVSGRRIVVIEDVVTSGGQVIESCAALRELGATVEHVACVIDRQAGGRERLARHGLALRSIFTQRDLRDAATT